MKITKTVVMLDSLFCDGSGEPCFFLDPDYDSGRCSLLHRPLTKIENREASIDLHVRCDKCVQEFGGVPKHECILCGSVFNAIPPKE